MLDIVDTKETTPMIDNKPTPDNNDEKINSTTSQVYAPKSTKTGNRLVKEVNVPITTPPNAHPSDKGMNSGLARALVGGLIGATLGTLAGALANARTSEGVNHAVKGVGNALKDVGGGLNLAAKGVGKAVKSVGEGASHAVVGGALDAVQGTVDRVKDTSEDARQSVVSVINTVKNTAENTGPDQQSYRIAKEHLVAEKSQNTTSEIGIQEYDQAQIADISPSMQKEQVGVTSYPPIDAGLVASTDVDFQAGEIVRREDSEQTPKV